MAEEYFIPPYPNAEPVILPEDQGAYDEDEGGGLAEFFRDMLSTATEHPIRSILELTPQMLGSTIGRQFLPEERQDQLSEAGLIPRMMEGLFAPYEGASQGLEEFLLGGNAQAQPQDKMARIPEGQSGAGERGRGFSQQDLASIMEAISSGDVATVRGDEVSSQESSPGGFSQSLPSETLDEMLAIQRDREMTQGERKIESDERRTQAEIASDLLQGSPSFFGGNTDDQLSTITMIEQLLESLFEK